jgi:hypothetical protein
VKLLALAAVLVPALAAQENATVRRAQAAYNELDYSGAIVEAREALTATLNREDRLVAYEILGYSYGALDSTRQAVEAFQQLIFLDPDREPDVERVSPRITSLYASALGQVLVVRRLRVDSGSFIAGRGAATVRYEVSRGAQTSTRVVGPGLDEVIDSQTVAGAASISWRAVGVRGDPVPPGDYQIIVTAREENRTEFSSAPLVVRVRHGAVDTVAHLTALPGYAEQPEMVTPPRDWRPMMLSLLYTGIGAGTYLAIERVSLGSGPRIGVIAVSGAALASGLAMSLRKPEARPSATNIRYNQLLREFLSKRNAEIARENSVRRSQVLLTVSPGQ